MIDCSSLDKETFSVKLLKNAYINSIPLRGEFELTARCNFNCKMCYVHLSDSQAKRIGRELTTKEWIKIASDAREAGMLYLTLTGGEIFMRPDFKELYLELANMGFLITLMTNGYMIDEQVMEWLAPIPPFSIRITVYGTSNAVYEKVCHINNGFDKVNRAIDLIRAADIPLKLTGTIIKDNQSDLLNLYEYANSKKLSFNHTISVVNPVRGATSNVNECRLNIATLLSEPGAFTHKTHGLYYHGSTPMQDCSSYRNAFWVTWNGMLQQCGFLDYGAVNLLNTDFKCSWDSLVYKLGLLEKPNKCLNCKYEKFCKKCPGEICANCGDVNTPSEAFCNQAIELYTLLHK